MNNQELNTIAQMYASQKSQLEAAKKDLAQKIIDYNNALKSLKNEKNELDNANANHDAKGAKIAKEEIAKLKANFEKCKADVEQSKANVSVLQESINSLNDRVKNDPEMGEFLKSVLQKRYERQINKDNKEIEKLRNNVTKLQTMQTLCNNDADIAKNYKGLLNAKEEIKKLNDDLAKATSNDEKNKINEKIKKQKEKYQNLKTAIITHAKRKGIENLTEDTIDSSIDSVEQSGIIVTKGEKDLKSTFEKSLKRTNKKIKVIGKNLHQYSAALETELSTTPEMQTTSMALTNNVGGFRKFLNAIRHPIQTYRNWRNRQNVPQPQETEENRQETESDISDNKFRDSLKNVDVRNMVNDIQKEQLKNARQPHDTSRDDEGR